MRTARLVGLSLDGKSLIVATEDGEELQIAADDRLRAAIRGDRPRLGQLEIEMKTSLSPRDIQTRIRAGESLEDVTRLAGIPLDRVERFAAPVLAEREHIAAVAMSASVRRRGETSGHRSLRITVTERLVTRGVDIDTVTLGLLPAGRRPVGGDGRLHLRHGEPARLLHLRPAQPVLGRGQRRGPPAARRAAHRSAAGRRRPTDVRARRRGHRADGGPERRAGPGPGDPGAVPGQPRQRRGRRADRRGAPAAPSGGRPAAAARRRRLQRGLRPGLLRAERRHRGAGDRPGGAAGSRPWWSTTRSSPASRWTASRRPSRTTRRCRPSCRPRCRAPTSSRREIEVADPARDRAGAARGARPSSTRTGGPAGRKRATVPSWDEIMFGGPKRSR